MPVIKIHGSDDPSTYSVYASSGLPAGAVAISNATASIPGVAKTFVQSPPVFPATTGAPVTTPAAGTVAFDHATSILWVYNGTDWVQVALTVPV